MIKRKRKRVLIILEKCLRCPYCKFIKTILVDGFYCMQVLDSETGLPKQISDISGIINIDFPEWCPLEDEN